MKLFAKSKPLLLILAAILLAGAACSARAETDAAGLPICGYIVAKKRKSEVVRQGTYDKFRHCAASCVITRACGPADSVEIGILKEIYDALGFGDPDIEDLRADIEGTQIGLSRDVKKRADCYVACDRVYPKHSK